MKEAYFGITTKQVDFLKEDLEGPVATETINGNLLTFVEMDIWEVRDYLKSMGIKTEIVQGKDEERINEEDTIDILKVVDASEFLKDKNVDNGEDYGIITDEDEYPQFDKIKTFADLQKFMKEHPDVPIYFVTASEIGPYTDGI